MCAKTNARSIRYSNLFWGHVVEQARKLVDCVHGDSSALKCRAKFVEFFGGNRSGRGERHNRQRWQQVVEVDGVWLNQQVRKQVESQVGIGCARNRQTQVDLGAHHDQAHIASGVITNKGVEFFWHHPEGVALRRFTKLRVRIPNVEHAAVAREGSQTVAPGL